MGTEVNVKGKVFGNGKPIVCVPVVETTTDKILKEIQILVEKKVEMIEWRVDSFERCKDLNAVREILKQLETMLEETPFLYTFRTKKQGGFTSIREEELCDLYEIGAEASVVDFIDVEYFELKQPSAMINKWKHMGVKVIASHHDYEGTPQEEVMNMLLDRMQQGGADLVKLCVMPHDKSDVLRLLNIAHHFTEDKRNVPIIAISMGADGLMSRICGETFGSCITFGTHEKASAAGQMEMNKLQQILCWIHETRE